MVNLKEYKFPYNSFIGGWFIPNKLCDDIINYFKKNKNNAVEGYIGENSKFVIDKKIKDSIDLRIKNTNSDYPFNEYRTYLQYCLNKYLKKYPDANECSKFNVDVTYNIQYYPINGGFKTWHSESNNKMTCNRYLVFMTYLNNAGNFGTEFKYQKIKTKFPL